MSRFPWRRIVLSVVIVLKLGTREMSRFPWRRIVLSVVIVLKVGK